MEMLIEIPFILRCCIVYPQQLQSTQIFSFYELDICSDFRETFVMILEIHLYNDFRNTFVVIL